MSISTIEDLIHLPVNELKTLRKNISLVIITKEKPNKVKLFNKIDKLLKAKGLVSIPSKDEKWYIIKSKNLIIFNCPHYCGKITFMNSFYKQIHNIYIECGINADISENDIELHYNGVNTQLDYYLNKR